MERALNPILAELLAMPNVTDICFNRHDEIYVDRGRGFERLAPASLLFHSEQEYRNFILEEISQSGKVWDAKLPFLRHSVRNSPHPHSHFRLFLSMESLFRSEDYRCGLACLLKNPN